MNNRPKNDEQMIDQILDQIKKQAALPGADAWKKGIQKKALKEFTGLVNKFLEDINVFLELVKPHFQPLARLDYLLAEVAETQLVLILFLNNMKGPGKTMDVNGSIVDKDKVMEQLPGVHSQAAEKIDTIVPLIKTYEKTRKEFIKNRKKILEKDTACGKDLEKLINMSNSVHDEHGNQPLKDLVQHFPAWYQSAKSGFKLIDDTYIGGPTVEDRLEKIQRNQDWAHERLVELKKPTSSGSTSSLFSSSEKKKKPESSSSEKSKHKVKM